MNAAQKIRLALTGDPNGEPHFQHEGPGVRRWITGGELPSVYATFHRRGELVEARCPTCDVPLCEFPANYDGDTAGQLIAVRMENHQH